MLRETLKTQNHITNEMIRALVETYPEVILKLFNEILKSGKSISSWEVGMIVPIHKDGSKLDPSNYRGITLMSCLSKLFLSILNARLIIFAVENKILRRNQLGFVEGNRTSDAHLIINHLVNKICHKKNSRIYSCFVDFKKAFDSVPRDILLKKLLNLGINGSFFNVIRDIYTTDKACVKNCNTRSALFDVQLGVRQGCILSPLLFNIFLCDLAKQFLAIGEGGKIKIGNMYINSLFWADDLVLMAESEDDLKTLLKILEEYCESNDLVINTKKTKCMTFNKTGRLIVRDFYLNGARLENVRSYKYLGFILTPSGEINTGLQDLRDRGFKAFMKIKRDFGTAFNQHVPTSLQLFESLIKPIILYCSDFWGCLSIPKVKKMENLYSHMCKTSPIEKLFTSICKQILGVQKQTTNIGVLLEMGLVPLHHYAIKFCLKNWERIKNGNANEMLLAMSQETSVTNMPWTTGVKYTLDSLGMHSFYINDYSDKHPFIFKRVFERLSDIFHQTSFEEISSNDSKLRTYAIFKTEKGLEDYLLNVRNLHVRKLISKFRLSNHRLMIEVGRHRGLSVDERVCPFCPRSIENEFHFLFDCKMYEAQRTIFLNPITRQIRGFQNLTQEGKMELLMCNMDQKLCKYIANCLELRDFLESKPKRNT